MKTFLQLSEIITSHRLCEPIHTWLVSETDDLISKSWPLTLPERIKEVQVITLTKPPPKVMRLWGKHMEFPPEEAFQNLKKGAEASEKDKKYKEIKSQPSRTVNQRFRGIEIESTEEEINLSYHVYSNQT